MVLKHFGAVVAIALAIAASPHQTRAQNPAGPDGRLALGATSVWSDGRFVMETDPAGAFDALGSAQQSLEYATNPLKAEAGHPLTYILTGSLLGGTVGALAGWWIDENTLYLETVPTYQSPGDHSGDHYHTTRGAAIGAAVGGLAGGAAYLVRLRF